MLARLGVSNTATVTLDVLPNQQDLQVWSPYNHSRLRPCGGMSKRVTESPGDIILSFGALATWYRVMPESIANSETDSSVVKR